MEKHNCMSNHKNEVLGKYECRAFVRGNVAYALDALPQTHVEITTGTPWAQQTIYLCGTHHTQFINRKPINITVPKEDNMTNIIIPTTGPEMDDLNAPFMTAGEIRLSNSLKEDNMNINEIISNNARMETNTPDSPVGGSNDKDKTFRSLCSKCTKQIGENWYHASVEDLRTCVGAAPAPVKNKFVKDEETHVVSNSATGDKFFFDPSRLVVMGEMRKLRNEGHTIKKVAKSAKTGEWFVCWTPKS